MEEMKFCPHCGEKVDGKGAYCGKCGGRLHEVTAGGTVQRGGSAPGVHTGRGLKILVAAIAVVVCVTVMFCISKNSDKNRIVGSWLQMDESGALTGYGMIFYEDGRLLDTESGMEAEYELSDGKIDVVYEGAWDTQTYTFTYELTGDELEMTLEDTDETVLLKRSNG